MRAASRAVAGLLVAAALFVGTPDAVAQASGAPTCPVAVGDLPLTVAVPFSGTPRPVAGDDGDLASISLLCAYGEGVEPSAELTVRWDPDATNACAETETVVADGVDAAAFTAAATGLADRLGGTCPPEEPATFPVEQAAVAAAALGLVAALVVAVRRRKRPERRETPVVAERGRRVEEAAGGRPGPSDETTLVEPSTRRPADLGPIVELLRADDAFARSTTGQLVALSAVAYRAGNDAAGDAAKAAALDAGPGSARQDLADLAGSLAHQVVAAGR
jgi:hypothetical protein